MKRFPELKPNFWDVIVVLAVIALAALSAMTVWRGGTETGALTAVVTADGQEIDRFAPADLLNAPRTYSYNGVTLCAVLTALALAFSYLENFFPLSLAIPIPGIKLGLANIVTVFALYALGPAQALLILTGRCLLGAVFAGNMNALIFSLLGGFSAMLVMILLSRSRHLSIYGVSIGGAAAHNCGQIAAACLTLGSMAPLYYLPILLGASLITGAVTGVAAACLFRALVHTNILR